MRRRRFRDVAERRLLLIAATLLTACGARSALPVPDGPQGDGGGPSACGEGPMALSAVVTVESATADSEPEGSPSLAGAGSRAFLGWLHWDAGTVEFAIVTADLSGGAIDLAPIVHVEPGNTSNPYNFQIAFAGDRLSAFWAQDDGSILGRRFLPDLTPAGPTAPVVPPHAAQQTMATSALGAGAFTLVTWADQGPDLGFRTFAASFAPDGTAAGAPALLHEGTGYDYQTTLAFGAGQLFGVWSTHAEQSPMASISTTLAAIDPGSATVTSSELVDTGAHEQPTSLAVEADRVSVALLDVQARIVSRPFGGGAFVERASMEASSGVAIAAGACGRLAVLVPVGEMSPDHPMPTGLSLRSVGRPGSVELPVNGTSVEWSGLAAVDGGFVAAWIEGAAATSPGRTLRMAYVAAP